MADQEKHSFFGENRSLFSDYYLKERLRNTPEWKQDLSEPFEQALQLYRKNKAALPGMNEAQTENEFIQPVMEQVLGFHYDVQKAEKSRGRTNIPDYIFFPDEESLKSAQQNRDSDKYYNDALALGDAKYWDRPLDSKGVAEKDLYTNSNPSFQIVNYLTVTGLEWGILTNGSRWRLYSTKARSRIDSYFEIDLKQILEEEDHEQFKYFYHFFHRQAYEKDPETSQSFVERVFEGSIDYGSRLEKQLKDLIFEDVFLLLSRGFLQYRDEEIGIDEETQESLDEIYQGTLRLLYRLLFLLHAESRGLLPLDNKGYLQYSLMELKKDIANRIDKDLPQSMRSFDVWNDLDSLFHIIDLGDPDLNVPRYNGGLFRQDHPNNRFLTEHKIADKYLVPALELLTRETKPDESGRKPFIDYKSLNVEQLGSIYEGLLEFHLRQANQPLAVVKENGNEVYKSMSEADNPNMILEKGELYLENDKGERKATGSYYTPHYIVEYIVEHTLGPVFEERAATFEELMEKLEPKYEKFKELDEKIAEGDRSERIHNRRKELNLEISTLENRAVETILSLKICDPAMGSGHFLKEATDKLAEKIITLLAEYPTNPVTNLLENIRSQILESLEEQNITIDADEHLKDTNLIKRMVMKRSIYGVDLNPMAVELAKLSLWLDSFTVGAPLSFLDHHLKVGNSLIGTTVKEVKHTLELDDERQIEAFGGPFSALLTATELMRDVSLSTDATFSEIKESVATFNEYEKAVKPYKRLLDLWISRHFDNAKAIALLRQYPGKVIKEVKGEKSDLHENYVTVLEGAEVQADEKRFFHWELEFPEVFIDLKHSKWLENPGFDAVVGNPPYVQSHSIDKLTKNYIYETYSTIEYQINTYGIFTEKFIDLLRNKAFYGSIIPNFWLSTKYGAKLREEVFLKNTATQIINLFEIFEAATVDTCILIGKKDSEEIFPKETQVKSISSKFKSINERLNAISQEDWQYDKIKLFNESDNEVIINFRKTLELKADKTLNDFFNFHQGMKPYEKGKGTPPQTRQMMDEKIYHADTKKDESYLPLLKARNIQRFLVKGESGFIKYGENLAAPRKINWFQGERILLNRILSDDKIDGVVIDDKAINNTDIFNLLPKRNDVDTQVFLPIIVSKLCSTFFKIKNINLSRAAYPKINVDTLEKFPVPNLDQKVPADLNNRIGQKSDSYKNLLKDLCKKNLDFYKKEYELQNALDPFKFLNKGVEFKSFSNVFADAIKYGEQLTGEVDIGTIHHDIEELRLRPDGARWLLSTQLKHRDSETDWDDWVKEDEHTIVRTTPDIYRFKLSNEEARYWQQSFEVLDEFENSGNFPGGKTRTTHEKLMKSEVPVFDDSANIEPLIELREELAEVKEKIEKTDWLIDQVVYRLYGLSEEEIEIVEGSLG